MKLPDDVRGGVERALTEHGLGRRIVSALPVGGGCINNGARLESDSGATLFLKWNPLAPPGMFEAEADGLRALAASTGLRVPAAIAVAGHDATAPWLLLEHVAGGSPTHGTLRQLGYGLGELHEAAATGTFGWERDNWIGSLDQANGPMESWALFWRNRRIGPQLALARTGGRARDPAFDQLIELIPMALGDVTRSQLLHGDLWSGNWFADADGVPVLIDPAVYRGHGEVDLAMSELFGGFGPAFYDAYGEVVEIPPEYTAFRRDLYQLYYLLVHVNLFGAAYEAGSVRAARRVISELR